MDNSLIEILSYTSWAPVLDLDVQKKITAALEEGKLLFLPQLAFELTTHEKCFLSADFSDPTRKNISLDPRTQQLKGALGGHEEQMQMKEMLLRFSHSARQLMARLMPHYEKSLETGRTSFRPVEITDRKTSYRKDDKRLHVDAFPANPNQGKRILRVFTNVNPHNKPRIWRIGEPFETVAKRFSPTVSKFWSASSFLLKTLKITKSYRTEYDHTMLQIHDRMKKDRHYQQQASQIEQHFLPHTSWIVSTDKVSHAALQGQHAFEQTFYLPVTGMLDPHQSPLKMLERLIGRKLA